MPYTAGFRNNLKLRQHYQKHGNEFNAVNEADYLQMADTFLGKPITRDMLECTRPSNGDYVRYNKLTNEFGVVDKNNFILTYYKKTIPCQKYPTVIDFMKDECK